MKRTQSATFGLEIKIPKLNISGQPVSKKQSSGSHHHYNTERPTGSHIRTEPNALNLAPPTKSMLNNLGRTDIGKSDYSKRLLYDNEAIHTKYSQLQRSYVQLQNSVKSLNDQYKSLKEAFIALNGLNTRLPNRSRDYDNPLNALEESNSQIDASPEDNTDDVDTVRMLLDLERSTKLKLMQQHRQLQTELETLRSSSHLITMRSSNIENVLRLQRENSELRQIIKKMSDIMAGESRMHTPSRHTS